MASTETRLGDERFEIVQAAQHNHPVLKNGGRRFVAVLTAGKPHPAVRYLIEVGTWGNGPEYEILGSIHNEPAVFDPRTGIRLPLDQLPYKHSTGLKAFVTVTRTRTIPRYTYMVYSQYDGSSKVYHGKP